MPLPIFLVLPYNNAISSADRFRLTGLLGDNTSRIIQLVWRLRR